MYNAILRLNTGLPLSALSVLGAVTADRFQREVTTMEQLTGPVLYLLIAFGMVTAVFLALVLWRSILTTHEDDQLCIDAAGDHVAQEQRELIAKITRLSKPIATSG